MADHIIHNLPQPLPLHLAGAKFRPCRWSDLSDRTKPDTWGIECKPAGKRHYRPVGWQMKANPFATKDEAAALCNQLNAAAAGVEVAEVAPQTVTQAVTRALASERLPCSRCTSEIWCEMHGCKLPASAGVGGRDE